MQGFYFGAPSTLLSNHTNESSLMAVQGWLAKLGHVLTGPAKLPSTQHYDAATDRAGNAYDHSANVRHKPLCSCCPPRWSALACCMADAELAVLAYDCLHMASFGSRRWTSYDPSV